MKLANLSEDQRILYWKQKSNEMEELKEQKMLDEKAAYKAATGALKYALLTGFLIPTGDDPEADASTDQQIAAAAKKIFAPSKPADTKADSLEGLDF